MLVDEVTLQIYLFAFFISIKNYFSAQTIMKKKMLHPNIEADIYVDIIIIIMLNPMEPFTPEKTSLIIEGYG